MPRGYDTRGHPNRQVAKETWSNDTGTEHYGTVETTATNTYGNGVMGASFTVGPFRRPERANMAASALANRVRNKGGSPRHYTNPIERGL
jgi:hypothetical protein